MVLGEGYNRVFRKQKLVNLKIVNIGLIVVTLALALLQGACVKESAVLTGDGVHLKFSCDTLTFDTVFTTLGTTTANIRVYNPYDEPVRIATITLAGGYGSRFRLNVDGDTSMTVRGTVIEPHDSLFVFVQANINPNSSLTPFLVEDAIVFAIDGASGADRVVLTAYGRNACYHLPDHVVHDQYGNAYPYSVINCREWDHTRPHVIMGYAVVDEDSLLVLGAGEELYFGSQAVLWVYDGGTLRVEGTVDQPVLFTSVRHDDYYDYLPGQGGYIWLSTGSRNNVVDYAVIENATIGLLCDTVAGSNPTLAISNSVVRNMSLAGIVGQGSWIEGDNLLVYSCQTATLALQYGGRYRFGSSTFANYWNFGARKSPSIVLNNYYTYGQTIFARSLTEASFANCIVAGTYGDGELLFDALPEAAFNVSFEHCLLAADSAAVAAYAATGTGNLYGKRRRPLFLDTAADNYHLLPNSPARAAGSTAGRRTASDIAAVPWEASPAIGAYEYVDTATLHNPQTTFSISREQRANHAAFALCRGEKTRVAKKPTHKTFKPSSLSQCITTSQASWPRSTRPTPWSTATGLATRLKLH